MFYATPKSEGPTNCQRCNAPIEQKAGPGRKKKYCREWCAKEFRRTATVIDVDGQRFDAYPIRDNPVLGA
ncbi:hypothetical protein [Streptomyces tubercidicus]|uniref:hypothetical protein n=1 Tax=Streptomyces tubercidicus TaxID=47759 RepID=UPI0037B3EFA3